MRRPAYNESGSISWSRIGLTNRAAATYLFVRRKRLEYNLLDSSCASSWPTSYIYRSAIIQQKDSNWYLLAIEASGDRVNSLSSKPKKPTPLLSSGSNSRGSSDPRPNNGAKITTWIFRSRDTRSKRDPFHCYAHALTTLSLFKCYNGEFTLYSHTCARSA